MRAFRDLPVNRKLSLIGLGTTCALLAAACVAFAGYERYTLRSEMRERVVAVSRVLAAGLAHALETKDRESATQTLRSLNDDDIGRACVYDAQGQVFASWRGQTSETAWPKPRSDGYEFRDGALDGFTEVASGGRRLGGVFVEYSLADIRVAMTRDLAIAAAFAIVAGAIAWLLERRLHQVVSMPLLHLADTATAVARDRNYAIRAVKEVDDEFGRLVDSFNDMLAQIQARDRDLEHRVAERTRSLEAEMAERRQAEVELKCSEQLLQKTQNVAGLGSYHFDVATGQWTGSPTLNELFGIDASYPHDVAGWLALVVPEERATMQAYLEQHVLAQKQRFNREYRIRRHHDQAERWVSGLGELEFDANGQPVRMIGTIQDVTERKHAEIELSYERDQLKALLDACPDSIYFKDRQSRIVRMSASKARRLLETVPVMRERLQAHTGGDIAALFVGLTDFDTYKAEDAQKAYDDEQQIIRTGQPLVDQLEKQTALAGTVIWHLTTKMPWYDRNGQIVGTFGISKDVTDLKRAEENLESAHRELVVASRQAGMAEIATGVLHNVGNALNSVNVSATIALDGLRASRAAYVSRLAGLLQQHAHDLGDFLTHDPKGRQIPEYLSALGKTLEDEHRVIVRELEDVRKNVEHVKEIVSMQQSYARVAGVTEPINTVDIIEDAIRLNSAAMNRKQISLERDFNINPVVTTDRHKVLQILVNLLRNAKHACDDSEQAEKCIKVRVAQTGDRLRISVIDNGVGIPPENLVKIFSHGFTTRKNGHGFGLHSGALAAKELGGALTVQSEGVGRGATFTLELPLTNGPAATAAEKAPA